MAKLKKGGLGRGLDSLISMNLDLEQEAVSGQDKKNETRRTDAQKTKPQETMIPIRQIDPNRSQPRRQFDEESIRELSESIRQYGVIQPIVVQKKEDSRYEIVVGERRWRAARLAGLQEVPVLVKSYQEQELAEISLVENIQRENLNPIEEAMAYRRLIQEFHLKQEDVARKVSKNRTVIANSLRLLKLPFKVQQMLVEGVLSIGHAKVLLSIDREDLVEEAAGYIAEKGLSVRETEQYVKGLLHPKEKKAKAKAKFEQEELYREMEDQIRQKTGTKAKIIRREEEKGKIEIEYYSLGDLERIMEFLS